jgi:hypothetical protein
VNIKNIIKEWFADEYDNEPRLSDKINIRRGITKQNDVDKSRKTDAILFDFIVPMVNNRVLKGEPIPLYKNPKTLMGIDMGARGVLLEDGTFFIAKTMYATHDDILKKLAEKKIISDGSRYEYWNNYPDEYVCVERVGLTKKFSPSTLYFDEGDNFLDYVYDTHFTNARKAFGFDFIEQRLDENRKTKQIINEEVDAIYGFTKAPIDVSEKNFEEAQHLVDRFGYRGLGVGTFLTTTFLWRCVDENEYDIIQKTGKIVGGSWAAGPERYFGASFSGSREDALNFGISWKKHGRLSGELYLIGINAEDKEFLNLNMIERLKEQGESYRVDDFLINTSLGDHTLGFSVRDVELDDIRFIYTVDDDTKQLTDITFDVL